MAKDLISDGLAVSYFYNFIKRLFDNVGEASQVRSNDVLYAFTDENVVLEVVLPKLLNQQEIKKCEDLVYGNTEVRLSIERGRDMVFFIEKTESVKKKVIDFPTVIGTIVEFLLIDIDKLSGFVEQDTASDEWKEREEQELAKFKEVLEFLIGSYAVTRGKVNVNFR